jgi:MIP family channel proteins
VQDRGPAAYVTEFIGTLFLVFFITAGVSLFVTQPTPQNPTPYIDFGIIGFVHFFALFALVQGLAIVSGAHFNPAVTVAMTALRQIKPPDAVIYIIAQLAGAVVGALLTKLLLNDFANADAVNFGAPAVSDLTLEGKTGLGMIAEFIGTFFLVLTIVAVAVDPRVDRALAPLAIGVALGIGAFVFAPMTGASMNPARAFGPDLVSGEWDGVGKFLLVYVLAPVLAGLTAAIGYMNLLVTRGAKGPDTLEPVG